MAMKFDVQAFINHPHVLTKRKDGLVIFNYDHGCTYDKAWDDITMQARGLILEEATGKIIARCMKKFFNINETTETKFENLPNISFTATEKQDGYLGLYYRWRGEEHIATRGSFESEMAVWGTDWFRRNVRTSVLDDDWTYHFEIIYSRKIVIAYDFEGLVLLTAINKETGEEMPYGRLCDEAKAMGVRVTPLMPAFGSLLELAEYTKSLPGNKEGCVVTFSNGLKVKIKGDEYCRIHKIISNMTPLAFWEAYDINKEAIPVEYLQSIPEEFREVSDGIKEAIEGRINATVSEMERVCKEVEASFPPDVSDKDFVAKVKSLHPKDFGWIMYCHKGNRKKLVTAIHRNSRPTNNVLVDDAG
jgi:RNA ligase